MMSAANLSLRTGNPITSGFQDLVTTYLSAGEAQQL
jgi:hypothetical protein